MKTLPHILPGLTPAQCTMLELLQYPNPQGLPPQEVTWRDYARTHLNAALNLQAKNLDELLAHPTMLGPKTLVNPKRDRSAETPTETRWKDMIFAALKAIAETAPADGSAPTAGQIDIEIHYFKQSGKWYASGKLSVPAGISMLELQERVAALHEAGQLPGLQLGAGKQFDIVCMSAEHPLGFPFMHRAENSMAPSVEARIETLKACINELASCLETELCCRPTVGSSAPAQALANARRLAPKRADEMAAQV